MALLNQTPQAYYDGNDYGGYQFVSLNDIINQFMFVYVGEDKIISKASRTDVAFHAQRALAELSFDTLKSCKAQEITVPASLQMTLPQDYVNYTKISWVDSAGIKHPLYPASKTSNPSNPYQNSDGDFKITAIGALKSASYTLSERNKVVLDGEYNQILPGMIVTDLAEGTNGFIQPGTFVKQVFNNNGITTVTLRLSDGTDTYPLWADDAGSTAHLVSDISVPLTFSNKNAPTIMSEKNSVVVEVTATGTESSEFGGQILSGSSGSFANLEVGMLIANSGWPSGTFITSVNDTYITLSSDQLDPSVLVYPATFNAIFLSPTSSSDTWSNYKSANLSQPDHYDHYAHHAHDHDHDHVFNNRYGLDPQHSQGNGSFYIDCVSGKIHFSSNISGETVILDYISDSLGTDDEMQVHKFAEEAMYKSISYAILSGKSNIPEYQVNRFKKERFAAIRTAKLRLSNLKLEELTQILRGKSKWIKH